MRTRAVLAIGCHLGVHSLCSANVPKSGRRRSFFDAMMVSGSGAIRIGDGHQDAR